MRVRGNENSVAIGDGWLAADPEAIGGALEKRAAAG